MASSAMLPGVIAVEGTGQERGSQMAALDQPYSLNKKVTVPPKEALTSPPSGIYNVDYRPVATCVLLPAFLLGKREFSGWLFCSHFTFLCWVHSKWSHLFRMITLTSSVKSIEGLTWTSLREPLQIPELEMNGVLEETFCYLSRERD